MFQFTRFPPQTLCIQIWVTGRYPSRVSPFGYPRIIASVQLPVAFRRLRVLHRRLVPRHSSHTLRSLHCSNFFTMRVPLVDMQLSKCSASRQTADEPPTGEEKWYPRLFRLSRPQGRFRALEPEKESIRFLCRASSSERPCPCPAFRRPRSACPPPGRTPSASL